MPGSVGPRPRRARRGRPTRGRGASRVGDPDDRLPPRRCSRVRQIPCRAAAARSRSAGSRCPGARRTPSCSKRRPPSARLRAAAASRTRRVPPTLTSRISPASPLSMANARWTTTRQSAQRRGQLGRTDVHPVELEVPRRVRRFADVDPDHARHCRMRRASASRAEHVRGIPTHPVTATVVIEGLKLHFFP